MDGGCIQDRRIYLEHENAFRENLRRRADSFIHKFLTFSIQAAVFIAVFYLRSRIHLFIAEINAMLVALHLCTNRFICYVYLFAKDICYLYLLVICKDYLFVFIYYLDLFIICNYLLKVFICNVQVFVN